MRGRLPASKTAFVLVIAFLAGCAAPAATHLQNGATDPAAAGFSHVAVFPGAYDLSKNSHTLVAGTLSILPGEVTKIKSKLDGADIEIGFIRPDTKDPVPVIVDASPYYAPLTPQNLDKQVIAPLMVPDFVPHGYAYALVSVRGTGDSGGCMDFLGPSERADVDQAVTWLGTQNWSNGNVGLIGISYDGSTPWEAAAMGNPHLKTIVPSEGINDYFQLDYRNGTPNGFGLGTEFEGYWAAPLVNAPVSGITPTNFPARAACPESMKAGVGQAESAAMGDRDALGFWAARNLRPDVLSKYNGSVFIVEGFKDDNVDPAQPYPLAERMAANGVRVKHLLGQWGHQWPGSKPTSGTALRADWNEMLLHWFDHELKGIATADVGPVAEVQDSAGQWRVENAWPPADAKDTTFYLATGGKLSNDKPTTSDAQLATMLLPVPPGQGWAPGDAWEYPASTMCAACPTFATAPFAKEFRFAGLPRVHVTVTPAGPGGYLAAFLYAQDASGKLTQLGMGGGIDLRFADGSETMTPIIPGMPLVAKMELEPMDAVVPAGSKLVLVLHQGGYGDHLPPPDTFPVQVQTGEKSTLTLRAFERPDPSVFFSVPK